MLMLMQRAASVPDTGLWAEICNQVTAGSAYLPVLVMWVLMSAAMMAPTVIPALKTYNDLPAAASSGHGFAALLGGYLVVWIGFSAFAAAAQLWFAGLALVSGEGRSLVPGFSAFLLVLAGAYQFTALKQACLSKCKAPLAFFLQYWQAGTSGAVRMGLRLGLVCLGCCWALMLLAFVGGTMNLAWMGLATLIMALEKLPDLSRHITRPLGMALIGLGLWTGLAVF
ncbi:MAG: DUF2182 domain-containing protein [Rhodobacteraceae bacterium]|nr:DUF2182 domain-containing protein [Paracoccaceae bacterium]